jgi:uncharacterized protein YbaA (DUF1428 family)
MCRYLFFAFTHFLKGSLMPYVDGYVLPVPRKNLDAYRKIAQHAGSVWKSHGALEYRECAGEDLQVKMGLPFPAQIGAKEDETVVFAWIVFESRAHRDEVNAKVMADPRMKGFENEKDMPFDCHRMLYGGFETIVDL